MRLPSLAGPSSSPISLLPLALSLHAFFASAAPVPGVSPSYATNPVIYSNFPDPSIIQVGNTWYAFATNSGGINIQLATSPDFQTWTVVSGYDALPALGSWATAGATWAPDVIQRADGSFVMYYSAPVASTPSKHCVGAAFASSPAGPYTPSPQPLFCPIAQGGAIDADGFTDPATGSLYVVYKIDGNSDGGGGSCSNDVAPIQPTPIMLQQVASDGVTPLGNAIQLIDRDDSDGPLIEAPSLVKGADGVYTLFYSSNCYTSSAYTTKYATAPSVMGPYTKVGTVLATGTFPGVVGPGGADVSSDGTKLAFHSDIGGVESNGREMWTISITV